MRRVEDPSLVNWPRDLSWCAFMSLGLGDRSVCAGGLWDPLCTRSCGDEEGKGEEKSGGLVAGLSEEEEFWVRVGRRERNLACDGELMRVVGGGGEGGGCEIGVVEEECEETVLFGLIWEEQEE